MSVCVSEWERKRVLRRENRTDGRENTRCQRAQAFILYYTESYINFIKVMVKETCNEFNE